MRRVVPLVAALSAVACGDLGGCGQSDIDPAFIEANLLDVLPDDLENQLDADLGGKVVYVGNRIVSEEHEPGGEIRIVHYWQVAEPPGSMWRVFAHAVGEIDDDWINVDASDMRTGHPPAEWSARDIIRDEQAFAVPEGWTSDYVDVRVGLYRQGGQDAGDRMAIERGPADDESRVRAARIPLGESESAREAEPTSDAANDDQPLEAEPSEAEPLEADSPEGEAPDLD